MRFLYFLEKIRNPFLDYLFSLITHLGEETVFLAVSIIFFWCVSKREGYYILITGFVGTVVNQMLKLVCRIPRPWVKDPSFTIVESARAEATGYSFPSGHTQNIAGTFGGIARYSSKKWVRIASVTVIILVALSRMYLGVHTPLDVVTSLLIAAALVFGIYPFFSTEERFRKSMPYIVGVACAMCVAFLLYVLFIPNKDTIDPHNYKSAVKNAFTLLGCTVGLLVVYPIDVKFINFDTKAPWYAQIIKIAIGLAAVLGLKSGLSAPLVSLFGNEYIARAVRYFIVVVFAALVWPLTFKFFARMKVKCLDDFGGKVASFFNKRDTHTEEN